MKSFLAHYENARPKIREKLLEFSRLREANDDVLLEEMAFCVFAANSSAKMGLLASELLKPVLKKGELSDFKKAVHKKVRFYSKRAEYIYHNREKIRELEGLRNKLEKNGDHHSRRIFIRDNFKGFGMKEASHFLRNIGYKGYCIIDKHVLNAMTELGAIKSSKAPKNEKEYLITEKKIINFARKNKLDIDELDLALWSYKTGEIIK